MAHLARRLARFSFRARAADNHFILPGITLHQDGDAGQKGDVKRAARFFSQSFQPLSQAPGQLESFYRASLAFFRGSRPVERQLQPRQLAGQLTAPVFQLFGALCGGVGRILRVPSVSVGQARVRRRQFVALGCSTFPTQWITPFIPICVLNYAGHTPPCRKATRGSLPNQVIGNCNAIRSHRGEGMVALTISAINCK